jgi:hypothetical protein
MSVKKSVSEMLFVAFVFFGLVFGLIGCASAHIEIRDLIVETEATSMLGEEDVIMTGVIDYQNMVEKIFLEPEEEYYVYGLISVWNDGKLIVNESICMEVRSFHGFAVNRPYYLVFDANADIGTHTVEAVITSENTTVDASIAYEVLGEDEEEEEEVEEEEIDDEWLPCP